MAGGYQSSHRTKPSERRNPPLAEALACLVEENPDCLCGLEDQALELDRQLPVALRGRRSLFQNQHSLSQPRNRGTTIGLDENEKATLQKYLKSKNRSADSLESRAGSRPKQQQPENLDPHRGLQPGALTNFQSVGLEFVSRSSTTDKKTRFDSL